MLSFFCRECGKPVEPWPRHCADHPNAGSYEAAKDTVRPVGTPVVTGETPEQELRRLRSILLFIASHSCPTADSEGQACAHHDRARFELGLTDVPPESSRSVRRVDETHEELRARTAR